MSERTHPRTHPELLLGSAERFADDLAVIDGPVRLTYRELRDRAVEVARGVIGLGVRPGDRVGLWAPNSHRWMEVYFGLQMAGATVVPLNTRYRGLEAREILARVRARFVVVESGFLGFDYAEAALRPVAEDPTRHELTDLTAVELTVERGDGDRVLGRADLAARAGGTSHEHVLATARAVGPEDLSDVIFTSGTTGRPKGVMIRQGPTMDLYRDYGRLYPLRRGDRYLVSLPFFHTAGNKAGMVVSLLYGVAVVPMAVYDPAEALRLIEQERVSVMNGSPTIYYGLLESSDRTTRDLSSLRVAATGAAVVPVALIERARTDLPFERFFTAYGMTECIGTATMCREGDGDDVISSSNGRPLPGVELTVVDADGRALPPGGSGEVLIRGANVTPGYWEDPEATAATIDADGWLHSGDIGHLDPAGNLAITDRLKDMLTVGGFNVSPAEVEQVLARHPVVSEVAVVGLPDERLGEVPRAFVVLRPGVTGSADEIIAWCRDRLANFKVPRTVAFVHGLPRNASGKVLKGDLRAGG